MPATCICLNGSLLYQLSCTIVNLFTCTFGRINMSVCLSFVTSILCSLYEDADGSRCDVLETMPGLFRLLVPSRRHCRW